MLERILIATALLITGFVVYQLLHKQQIRRLAAQAITDPLLAGLRPGIPTIVYFTTPGCVPCQTQQQPALSKLQTDLGENVQVVKIDATQQPDDADRWGVMSAPTTFVLDETGTPRSVNHGVADADKLKKQLMAVVKV